MVGSHELVGLTLDEWIFKHWNEVTYCDIQELQRPQVFPHLIIYMYRATECWLVREFSFSLSLVDFAYRTLQSVPAADSKHYLDK